MVEIKIPLSIPYEQAHHLKVEIIGREVMVFFAKRGESKLIAKRKLNFQPDPGKVSAEYKDNVLVVKLEKQGRVKVIRI